MHLWYLPDLGSNPGSGATITSGGQPAIPKGAVRVCVARAPLSPLLVNSKGASGKFPWKVQISEEGEEESVGSVHCSFKLTEAASASQPSASDSQFTNSPTPSTSLRYPNLQSKKQTHEFVSRVSDELLLEEHISILGHSCLLDRTNNAVVAEISKALVKYEANDYGYGSFKTRLQCLAWKYGSSVPGDVLTQCVKFLLASGVLDADLQSGGEPINSSTPPQQSKRY